MYEASNLGFKSPRYFKSGNSTPNCSSKGFRRKNSLLKLGIVQKNQEYHPRNHKLAKNSVYYDSSVPMKDQSFQNSIPTNQSQDSHGSFSLKKSLRQSQYSQSGFFNERKRYEHQMMLLKKDIEKLKKEIQYKDKQISQSQQNKSQFKEIQMELVETYRVINYYEGKIKEQQKIVQYFEGIVDFEVGSKSKGKLKQGLDFKEIIEFFRNQSIQLKGQVQKSNHQNTKLIVKLQKLQTKCINLDKAYNQAQKRLRKSPTTYETTNLPTFKETQKVATIYEARLQSSQNKIAMRRKDDEISLTGSVRSQSSQKSFKPQNQLSQSYAGQDKNQVSKMYGNFNSKINKIEKELDFFRIENDKIQTELNQKIIQIGKLIRENDELKYMLETNGNNGESQNIALTFGKKFEENEQKDPLHQFVTSIPVNFTTLKKKQSSTKDSTKEKGPTLNVSNSSPSRKQTTSKTQQRKNELKNLSLNEISKKIQQTQSKIYKFKQIMPETVRKLRYNLIREDVTYSKLLDTICDKLVLSQDSSEILQELQDMPYQLTSKQSSSFVFEYKKIAAYIKDKQMSSQKKNTNEPNKDLSKQEQSRNFRQKVKQIFSQNIPSFKNITIRRDASMTSQLTKTFKNRLAELQPYMRDKKKGVMNFQQAQKRFKDDWHLGDEEIDFICLKSCQQTGQYAKFDFYKTINFFLEN